MRLDSHHFGVSIPSTSDSPGSDEWTALPPVWSGGKADTPDIALVFINPTYGNQSAREFWPDHCRAPHIGAARFWKFVVSCGLMPSSILDGLPPDQEWTTGIATGFYLEAARAGLYVTNLVKATRTTSALPTAAYARTWIPLIADELAIVKPQIIIPLGTLTTSLLAGYPFRMRDAYEAAHPMALGSEVLGRLIFPAYFPSGRGEPVKSREMIIKIDRARLRQGIRLQE